MSGKTSSILEEIQAVQIEEFNVINLPDPIRSVLVLFTNFSVIFW